jgi:hypothetical protein
VRCHDVATLLEQTNRIVEDDRAQMHVPLCGRQIAVAGQLLNRLSSAAAHREVRAEGVSQDTGTACDRRSPI